MSLRAELLELIRESLPESQSKITAETSLIRSGLLDSSSLFNLAMWIEGQTESSLSPSSFDPARDWDTVENILRFIQDRRESR
jgi:acyl carrier protein